MMQVHVEEGLSPPDHARVTSFLEVGRRIDGSRLDDHLAGDLARAQPGNFHAAIATEGDAVVGYAQASAANEGLVIGCVAPLLGDAERAQLLRTLVDSLPAASGVTWWSTDDDAAMAASMGMHAGRRLLEMRRPLPMGEIAHDTGGVAVRPFRVGLDEAAWLEMNNAAFVWHGEQGGWALATLEQREHEPWFDPAGFLMHERDGRLAAFCWTKLHRSDTLVGEIYVIAVHPDFHGLGLGRALTVAGLQHLQSVAATSAMLYVDADNVGAVHLYETLGFTVTRTDQSYLRPPQGAST